MLQKGKEASVITAEGKVVMEFQVIEQLLNILE